MLSSFSKNMQLIYVVQSPKNNGFRRSWNNIIRSFFHFLLFKVKPLWIQLAYFLIASVLGYLALKVSKPRSGSVRPNDLDLFFTSVSSATVSSMSTVEMEVFSNAQLTVMAILMFLGGEVFTSMLGFQFARCKFPKHQADHGRSNYASSGNAFTTASNPPDYTHSRVAFSGLEIEKTDAVDLELNKTDFSASNTLKYDSIKCLGYVVLLYLLLVHIWGSSLIATYISLVPSAREVLTTKGLHLQTFSVFTTVSTFANCGFVPTNENMTVFKKNSGLLLILIPQILLGNTLYPPCLRFLIWVSEKFTKRAELRYILSNAGEIGYSHLFPSIRCCLLVATCVGFILLQLILFCSMEWNSQVMDGLTSYQKLVGAFFQVANSRFSGESVFDIATISQAILVLFVLMMYLPPYASFLPANLQNDEPESGKSCRKQRKNFMECLLLSRLSYLVIFIILICITEREKMMKDPLNFNVLNVTIEVISAYGNVGFTTGYSCSRRLEQDSSCKDACFGFVGRWSNTGKCILIIVMLFGRLKNFFNKGGSAWRLP